MDKEKEKRKMYNVINQFGEAYQINGVWYQDYVVQDTNGEQSIKRYVYDGANWNIDQQDTMTPLSEATEVNGVWQQQYNVTNVHTGQTETKIYKHNGKYWYPDNTAPNANTTATVSAAAGAAVDSAVQANEQKKINLMKKVTNEKVAIDLKKHVVNLDKCIVDLSKKSGIQLGGHRARVALVLDFSGSMRPLYRDGSVQKTLSRIIPLGLQFDDNGEVDVWLFHGGYRRMEGMNIANFDRYVTDVIDRSGERMGSTSYAPVLRDVYRKYITEEPNNMPAFVIFITDGSNDDRRNTDDIIRKTSEKNIFIQFIGQDVSRHERFEYLHKLDDLSGRPVDNTGFFNVADLNQLSDNEIYNQLLEQYVDWLNEAKRIGILK